MQAPDKYDITNQTYYFGIGASREGTKERKAEWGVSVGGTDEDGINSIISTSDGGYLAAGYFKSKNIYLENGIVLNNNGGKDAMIIKLDSEGIVEWAKSIGSTNDDEIKKVIETKNGDYVAVGYFQGSLELNDGTILNTASNGRDGIVIQFDSVGEIKYCKMVGGPGAQYEMIHSVIETTDGGYALTGEK